MPLINGLKMACEPCIRGHRSTKCTHANERLMVPVKKPGRPLSACPHPREQPCGCGSVTAAIPRKQTCHCGGDASASAPQVIPRVSNPAMAEAPSPTKVTFKIKKTNPRPSSSRKQSFDPVNFDRMDMNSVNIIPLEKAHAIHMPLTNEYTIPGPLQASDYTPQFAASQPQFAGGPMPPPPILHGLGGGSPHIHGANGFSDGSFMYNDLERVVESPLATPTKFTNEDSNNNVAIGSSCCAEPKPTINGGSKGTPNPSSCCAPKQTTHSHSSSSASSISEPEEIAVASCCSSTPATQKLKREYMSSNGLLLDNSTRIQHQIHPQNGITFNPGLYAQYVPQTVFMYPPTYGSFQNPLQPTEWRQAVRTNSYAHPQAEADLPPGAMSSFETTPVPDSLDTIHTCGCGDSCQCIGCAAHPYNDATQDYVRSAWSSMNLEQSSSEKVAANDRPMSHGNRDSNGNMAIQTQGMETISSPTALTPSSTTSGNGGDEQSLSASDFFFVNYPFASDGCGGDTQTCPCGDDCQCLGCTIHRQPALPCAGEKDACPCGDECECIGCTFHGNGGGDQ